MVIYTTGWNTIRVTMKLTACLKNDSGSFFRNQANARIRLEGQDEENG